MRGGQPLVCPQLYLGEATRMTQRQPQGEPNLRLGFEAGEMSLQTAQRPANSSSSGRLRISTSRKPDDRINRATSSLESMLVTVCAPR